MNIEIGKRYFGAFEEARVVMTIENGEVRWFWPASPMKEGRASYADFETWASESDRRNYIHANGERRIKLETTEPRPGTGDIPARAAGVLWVDVDNQAAFQWSTLADWAAWRAQAQ